MAGAKTEGTSSERRKGKPAEFRKLAQPMALSNMFGSMFAPAPAPVTDPIQQQLMMQLQQLVDGFGVPNPSSASPIAPILGQAAATDPAHILKSNFKVNPCLRRAPM